MIESISEGAAASPNLKRTRRKAAGFSEAAPKVDRLPPHSPEAEQGVLGCILLSPETCIAECLARSGKRKEFFYDLRHQTIYETVLQMNGESQAVDMITLQSRLKKQNRLDECGGLAYLTSLPDTVPSAANLSYYLEIVFEKWELRKIIQTCTEVVGRVYDYSGPIEDLKFSVQSDLGEVFGDSIDEVSKAVALGELKEPVAGDSTELVKDRTLCRKATMLVIGPTGSGKSSWAMQFACRLVNGKACFGLRPTGELKVLIIQAENDEGDLYEMREGIYEGCGFFQAERDKANRNVIIESCSDRTGARFIARVKQLLEEHKPDLLIIDPLLAYIGGDISKQELTSQFCREWLTPVIAKANCGCIIMHHPPKPKQDGGQSNATDDAYYGAGSADLFNWARAVIVLKPTKHHGIYELRLAKRGRRVGWVEADGVTPCYKRMIGHGENGLIYWRDVDKAEASKANAIPGRSKEDMLALVPMTGDVSKDALISKASAKGIGEKKARGFIAELTDAQHLYEWRTKRQGTNALKSLSRVPQTATESNHD